MKTILIRSFFVACAVACCHVAFAQDSSATPSEALSEPTDDPVLSFEFELSFDSKYLSYGLVDNNDPILTPRASVTAFDWVFAEISAVYDMTKYGRKAGYSNRAGRYSALYPAAGLCHEFSADDYSFLPTSVEMSLYYSYEYFPRTMTKAMDGYPDSQYITLEIALNDLWFEPHFFYERDIQRDNGTYLNLEVGHGFSLIDGEDKDSPTLVFRPSVAQGLGTTQRMRGYELAEHHGGLMDFCLKGELKWQITDFLALSGYVAYTDYIFDRSLRHAAREYEARGRYRNSYHFTTGLSICASF